MRVQVSPVLQVTVVAKGRTLLATAVQSGEVLRLAFEEQPPSTPQVLVDGVLHVVLERAPSPWTLGMWTMKVRRVEE